MLHLMVFEEKGTATEQNDEQNDDERTLVLGDEGISDERDEGCVSLLYGWPVRGSIQRERHPLDSTAQVTMGQL
jgi:hypothetical protein